MIEYGIKNPTDSHNTIYADLNRVIQTSDGFEVSELDDEHFFLVKVPTDDGIGELYIDTQDNRFFTVFSKIKSKYFDTTINKLTYNTVFDRAWFATEMLNEYKSYGHFRGSGGKYDNRFFLDDEEIMQYDKVSQLSFKSWGKAKRLLDLIQQDEILKHEFALTNIRIRKNLASTGDDFVIDDIGFNGKITSLGTSFIAHNLLLDSIKGYYKRVIVENVENTYGLHYSDEGITGQSIDINLPVRKDFDTEKIVGKLFSGKKPFMLLGITETKRNDFCRVDAIDLHVGHRLVFEIRPELMTIFLPKDACGNSVLRIYSLLQQTYDSLVSFRQDIFKNE